MTSCSDVIAALDQSIDDGVDVLIYTMGTPGVVPWRDVIATALRQLRAAGISVTVTNGQSGPNYNTVASAAVAPWTASFTTGTHGREFSDKELRNFAGGAGTPPASRMPKKLVK